MATLLVVEDNENLCALYQSELEEEGHEVMVAHDGKSGLEKALEERPDLVIMDISLPEKMDGLEAMSRLLGRNSSIPVIIYTAYGHYRENFMSWAAEEYVVKSGDLTPLKDAVNRVLNSGDDGGTVDVDELPGGVG
ncbi:MAG: response regulator [Planctomycetota bacterium]